MSGFAAAILIVEDEQIVAIDMQDQLESLGYRVVGTAMSGDEACQLVERERPDLVLMDIRIEGPVDGIETAQRIRKVRDTPIIFVTAHADVATVQRAKTAAPYGYLMKPFDTRDLHTTIQMALHKGAIDRQLRESRENLRAILDAQRHGTVMLDREGRVQFASRAMLVLTGKESRAVEGCSVAEVLTLSEEQAATLHEVSQRPQRERDKFTLVIGASSPRPRHLEVEVVDDPRDEQKKILFVYDVSPLFDLRRQLDENAAFEGIIGRSKSMRQIFQAIQELARVDSTVLIEGETGTGKELVARAIHQLSPRCAAPFVAVNCAALSEDLAASQLFGHRRGAFTGAFDSQQGFFETARGGTLFLDEIGDLPLRVQTTLLRVLEENTVTPLGDPRPRPVNVRVLAATHRDLVRETAEERFRQDLFYRIRVARISLPPLRDRREDIPLLVRAFLADHRAALGKWIDDVGDTTLAAIMAHEWPGNVRELRNALEFAVIRAKGSVLQPEDLPPELFEPEVGAGFEAAGLEKEDLIRAVLEQAQGNRTRAAALLGVSRATFYRRLRELGISDP